MTALRTMSLIRVVLVPYYVVIYEMNFTLCVLLVYNDNGSVQTLCITRVSALCTNARYVQSVCTDPLSL